MSEFHTNRAAALEALAAIKAHIESFPESAWSFTRNSDANDLAHVQDQLAGILAFLGIDE